jgi:hypothetical protein
LDDSDIGAALEQVRNINEGGAIARLAGQLRIGLRHIGGDLQMPPGSCLPT